MERGLQVQMLPAGENGIERSLLKRRPDDSAHARPVADDVEPPTRALPAVGGSSVVSTSTVVDLPAPLGPGSRRSRPGHLEVDPVDRADAPLELTDEPVDLDGALEHPGRVPED